MNINLESLKNNSMKTLNLFLRWISQLSWIKFILFIILISIGSDYLQSLFTNNVSDNWFGSITGLFVVFCFGSKLLIKSKIRAEDAAFNAILKAQEEALARQISDSRFNVVQSQINPHFLFNTLASLQYLIGSDSKKAQDLLGQIVTYLRYTLSSNNERKIVTVGEELKNCQAYLEIIKYRLSDRFTYFLEDTNISLNRAIPYTILQSILDSCIRFGIEPNVNFGYIKIYQEENTLIIENSVYSNNYISEQINDIYLKNVISTLQSIGYKIDFDILTDSLKIKISF